MQMKRIAALSLFAMTLAVPGIAADRDEDFGNIQGVVKDASGRAVTNATVHLMHKDRSGELADLEQAETNSAGKFEFKDVHNATYAVIAYSGGKSMRDRQSVRVLHGKDMNVELELKKGKEEEDERRAVKAGYADVDGVVVDDNRKPVANATVRLLDNDGSDKGDTFAEKKSDEHGYFKFRKVPSGKWLFIANKGKNKDSEDFSFKGTNAPDRVTLELK